MELIEGGRLELGIVEGRVMNPQSRKSYLVGAGIGLLSCLVFVVVNAPLGITTALSEVSGAVATPFFGSDVVAANPYWAKTIPAFDYGTLFLFGTLLGALLSSLIGGSFKWETVPETWRERFGTGVFLRLAVAFVGGVLTMFGARLAGGCTSGHGISGSLQLALSSWIFFLGLFVAGVVTARIVFAPKK